MEKELWTEKEYPRNGLNRFNLSKKFLIKLKSIYLKALNLNQKKV